MNPSTQDPRQQDGEGVAAFMKEPEKEIEAPTITDAEAKVLREAILRGSALVELKILDEELTFNTLSSDAESTKWSVQKIKLRRTIKADIEKQTGFPLMADELEDAIQNPMMRGLLAMLLKSRNGQSLSPAESAGIILEKPIEIIRVMFDRINAMSKELVFLAEKALAMDVNIKKSQALASSSTSS